MAEQQEGKRAVEGGLNIFDYKQFRQDLERAATSLSPMPANPPKQNLEEQASSAVFNAAHFAGYWLAWLPAHLIRGVWAGVCSAWEWAGE